jgi:iron complex transport system substrate-binding protein
MKIFQKIIIALIAFIFIKCKNETKQISISNKNEIKYAKGFSIENKKGFSILTVKNPWPNATKTYTYILQEKNGIIPDSLKQNITIQVPVKSIVVTSTTHLPSIEMLEEEKTLVGFPNLNYVSSDKIRALIDAKKIREVGNNQSLNTEVLLDLQSEISNLG